jgi:hypothetical protein
VSTKESLSSLAGLYLIRPDYSPIKSVGYSLSPSGLELSEIQVLGEEARATIEKGDLTF